MNLYIFDCFGVVVSDVSTLWMNRHFDEAQQELVRSEVYRKVDCGLLPFDASFEILAEIADISVEQARAEWDSCLYVLDDTVKLIDALRASGHEAVLLSNASRNYIDRLFSEHDLFKHFDKIFVSSDYGCAKPDRKFYQICLNGCSKTYQNIYFADDNPKNLVGLESLGIQPVLFTSAKGLAAKLHIVF